MLNLRTTQNYPKSWSKSRFSRSKSGNEFQFILKMLEIFKLILLGRAHASHPNFSNLDFLYMIKMLVLKKNVHLPFSISSFIENL